MWQGGSRTCLQIWRLVKQKKWSLYVFGSCSIDFRIVLRIAGLRSSVLFFGVLEGRICIINKLKLPSLLLITTLTIFGSCKINYYIDIMGVSPHYIYKCSTLHFLKVPSHDPTYLTHITITCNLSRSSFLQIQMGYFSQPFFSLFITYIPCMSLMLH